MPSLHDRISRRLEDGRDEYNDFGSDVENGRRNMFGLKTQKWHDREKERQRQRNKHRHRGDDPRHRTQGNRSHDRAQSESRNTDPERARSADKDRRHGRSKRADDKDKGRSLGRPEDSDRRQHASHRGSSKGIDASNAGAGRKKESSKAYDTTHPHLRVRDVLIDVAGKVFEDLLGGSARQPGENRKRHRRRQPRTNRDHDGENGERQHGHRERSPEKRLTEPAQQQRGTPPGPPRDYGQSGSYYQGHPLRHQQLPSDRPQGPPSQRQPNNAALLSHGRAPENDGPPPPRSSQGPRSGEDFSYGNNRPARRDEERQWKEGPEPRETGPRQPKTEARGLEEARKTDREPQKDSRRLRGQGPATHEVPGPSSVRDFGQSPKTGKSPQETVTSTSIDRDSDPEDETDRSSVSSRHSSLLTEQPAQDRGQHPEYGKHQGGAGRHHGYAQNSDEGRSDAAHLHMRGGGQYDDNEDDDSDAQYSEYEEFDDEYLDEVHIVRDDLGQTCTAPLVNKQGDYSPLSYVAANIKSRAYNSSSYDNAESKSGGYSPLSYAAAKARTANTEYTSEIHPGNSSKAFYEHCGRPDKVSLNLSSKGNSTSERHASRSPSYMPKNGYDKKEYAHTPLGKAPEPYGAFIDSESERPQSPKTSKSKNKPGKSNIRSSDFERSRNTEPFQTKSKPRKFNVRFEAGSESRSPRPKHAPKYKRPSLGTRCDTAGPTKEPPNHYATLEISPSTNPETIAILAKKMRIKVHPDMLKRKDPSMSETEKTAIDEHAKKVGGAAEILLDSTKRADYHQEIRNWEAKYGKLLWARSLKS